MFGKEKSYRQVSFSPRIIEDAISEFSNIFRDNDDEIRKIYLKYDTENDERIMIEKSIA